MTQCEAVLGLTRPPEDQPILLVVFSLATSEHDPADLEGDGIEIYLRGKWIDIRIASSNFSSLTSISVVKHAMQRKINS